MKVASARDQSRFISERWDDVSPPSPSVHSGKLGAKQNEEGMKASVVFEMKHSGNLYYSLWKQGEAQVGRYWIQVKQVSLHLLEKEKGQRMR